MADYSFQVSPTTSSQFDGVRITPIYNRLLPRPISGLACLVYYALQAPRDVFANHLECLGPVSHDDSVPSQICLETPRPRQIHLALLAVIPQGLLEVPEREPLSPARRGHLVGLDPGLKLDETAEDRQRGGQVPGRVRELDLDCAPARGRRRGEALVVGGYDWRLETGAFFGGDAGGDLIAPVVGEDDGLAGGFGLVTAGLAYALRLEYVGFAHGVGFGYGVLQFGVESEGL
ncbi:uncharacterized protein PG986_010443 [Apiospora aurea]|uniref:Uncharacterized protein n=1 Tax=Apiospora aurea TaxID=335848 RepID=A0ABR1Q2C1_9PEZI